MDDRLEVGSVIFEIVYDTRPPKEKYYIITGFTADSVLLSTVYINSVINPNLFPTQALKDLHVLITESDNPFLRYDSYVDCSFLHEKQTANVLAAVTSGDSKFGYVATVASKCLADILATIKSAPTIPAILKKKYGLI